MRIFILALLIALLPLRGWVGDSMAMGPGGPASAAAAARTGEPPCHAQAAAAPADHADGHAASGPQGDHSHPLCELCHGPALAASLPLPTSDGALAPPPRVALVEAFLSHLPLGERKPPIS